MKWEKVMESNSMEKEPGVQEVLEELKCSAIIWWNGGLDIGAQRYCAYSQCCFGLAIPYFLSFSYSY